MSEETYKKKVFFIFLLLFLLAVVSFIVIQYYNCFQRFIFIYINIYFIGKSLEIFYTKCKDRYKWDGMQVLILSSQCRFFATDRLLSEFVSPLSMPCYQNQHPKVQTTKPKKKCIVIIMFYRFSSWIV